MVVINTSACHCLTRKFKVSIETKTLHFTPKHTESIQTKLVSSSLRQFWILANLMSSNTSTNFFWFQSEGCKCNGWKNPNPLPSTPNPVDSTQSLASPTDACRSCSHTLSKAHQLSLSCDYCWYRSSICLMQLLCNRLYLCGHDADPTYFCNKFKYIFWLTSCKTCINAVKVKAGDVYI